MLYLRLTFETYLVFSYVHHRVSFAAFLVGLLTMVFICLVDDAKLPKIAKIGDCPWYLFIGGVLGGIYKTAAIILAPRIGFATFHIAAVSGQVCVSHTSVQNNHPFVLHFPVYISHTILYIFFSYNTFSKVDCWGIV